MPRSEVDPSISRGFEIVASLARGVEVYRIEEAHLLRVDRTPGGVKRTFYKPFMTPEDGLDYFPDALSLFETGSRLPKSVATSVDKNRRLILPDSLRRRKNENSQLITIDGDSISLFVSDKDLHVSANIDRLRDSITRVSIGIGPLRSMVDSGGDYASSVILNTIPKNKVNREAYLRDQNVFLDRDSGSVELRTQSGWSVAYTPTFPVEEALGRLFPEELKADHYGAPASADGWASADFLSEFGIEVRPPVAEKPIFVASPIASQ